MIMTSLPEFLRIQLQTHSWASTEPTPVETQSPGFFSVSLPIFDRCGKNLFDFSAKAVGFSRWFVIDRLEPKRQTPTR